MRIVFLHLGPTFNGDSLSVRPLGGTETALIGVARSLAKDGRNDVRVFTNTDKPGIFDGVVYAKLDHFFQLMRHESIDVLISIRQWVPFLLPSPSKLKVYFSPDAWDQPFLAKAFDVKVNLGGKPTVLGLFPPPLFLDDVDSIFCVGQWQADTFVEKLNFPRDKIFVTGNAIFPENFTPLPLSSRAPGLVYSSTPFRGLKHLANYFPAIKRQFPSALLEVFSGMGVYGASTLEDRTQYGALYTALEKCGAVSHGSIPQMALASIMCRNRVFAYPNTFAETFCISALEGMAAGLPVVTSKRAALCERVTDGVDGLLIDGEPGTAEYDGNFIAACLRLLRDDHLWRTMSTAAIAKAGTASYDNLAASWMEYFTTALGAHREYTIPRGEKIATLDRLEVPHPDNPKITVNIDRKTMDLFLKEAMGMYGCA